jgi:hypothetical protein
MPHDVGSALGRCRTSLWIVALPVLLLVTPGCGETRDDLAAVTGNVKLDGQPLPDAIVKFIPQGGKGVVAVGKTDGNGHYYLMASRTAEGASIGQNKVRITTYDILDQGGKQVPVPEKVPTKYNSETELAVTVESGDNTFDFDLSTAGGKVEQTKQSPLTQ